MGWVQAAVLLLQLIVKLFDAIKEHDDEIRKKKTEILQSGLRGVVDKDASRITAAFDDYNRL